MKAKQTQQFYLSTEGYYFIYRQDKYDPLITRATLFNIVGNKVDDIRVSAGYGQKEKTHFDVINEFESKITLNKYPIK